MKNSTRLLLAFGLAATTAFVAYGAYNVKQSLDNIQEKVERNDQRAKAIEQQLGL